MNDNNNTSKSFLAVNTLSSSMADTIKPFLSDIVSKEYPLNEMILRWQTLIQLIIGKKLDVNSIEAGYIKEGFEFILTLQDYYQAVLNAQGKVGATEATSTTYFAYTDKLQTLIKSWQALVPKKERDTLAYCIRTWVVVQLSKFQPDNSLSPEDYDVYANNWIAAGGVAPSLTEVIAVAFSWRGK